MPATYISVDFDDTLVIDRYPEIGNEVPNSIEILKSMISFKKSKVILLTNRNSVKSEEAKQWLESKGIEVWNVNKNPAQKFFTDSKKIFAHVYIDDKNAGTPKILVEDRNVIDWKSLIPDLIDRGFLPSNYSL